MRRHRSEKFAEGQRQYYLKKIVPRHIRVFAYSPQVEKWATVDGDAGQLDHSNRHWVRELTQHHLPDYIIARWHNIPNDAQKQHDKDVAGTSFSFCHFIRKWCELHAKTFFFLVETKVVGDFVMHSRQWKLPTSRNLEWSPRWRVVSLQCWNFQKIVHPQRKGSPRNKSNNETRTRQQANHLLTEGTVWQ